ncbi:MAG TPA: kelch repeat-containing protein, partial [Thermoplasmata archaeon]
MTGIYDWDTQPLILPPSFPAGEVAGEGAVMTTSDPHGTVLLFGGEAPSGLTNRTLTVNETNGYWNVAPVPVAPSPRANVSIATIGLGRYAVLFGGVVNLTSGACDNETWRFDFVNRSWTNVTNAIAPPPREDAAFAADDGSGFAVLEGGWDPSYSVGGAGASVTWNDTWLLNLTSLNWTRANVSGAPRPLFGSSLVAYPATHRFYLFGGCSTFCSNAMFSYVVGGNWTRVPEQGDVPSPRASASSAWASTYNVSMVFGGFVWGGNSYAPLNDTFQFDPVTLTWDLILSGIGPSSRFGSAGSFLGNNGCPGLFVVGGSSALVQTPADGWFLDTNPDLGSGCDIWGGDKIGGSGGPGTGNCSAATNLSVSVVDSSNFRGVPGATVQLIGRCGALSLGADASGYANFSALPNETVRVVTTAAGFHQNQTDVNLSLALPGPTFVRVLLDPLPSVHVQTFGISYEQGITNLENVSIFGGAFTFLGLTDPFGWLNVSAYSGPQGPTMFVALKAYYSNGSATANIPWTGVVSFSIVLFADGPFDVHITEFPDGLGVSGATGVITPVGAYAFGGPLVYATDVNGWFNTSLPQTNYSVSAQALGFLSNTSAPVAHLWAKRSVVTVNLTLLRGGD